MKVDIALGFTKGYIAEPYWPEREEVITIQKESGINKMRTPQRRNQALADYLRTRNLTQEDYDRLVQRAQRPFYVVGDVLLPYEADGHQPDEIVIPSHQMYGCLAQAASLASSSIRITRPEQVRTVLRSGEWFTGKIKQDDLWKRYVVVKAGTGTRLSNQRSLRISAFISEFTATGYLEFSEDIVRPDRVRDFLTFAGREVGIGASRKIAWGRFTVQTWDVP